MSYILDALRKSDKNRKRISVPNLPEVKEVMPDKPKKRQLWPYLIITALILNAGIFALWLGTWYSKKPNLIQQPSSGKQLESKVLTPAQETSETSAIKPVERPVISKQLMQAKPDIQRKDTPKSTQVTDIENQAGHNASSLEQIPVAEHPQSKPQAIAPSEPPAENRLYKLKELPSSVRKSLPAFSIAALLYSSSPSSRMVRVNDEMMHEGEVLTSGLKLEEITADGVIFSYQNYRFFVGMK